jgi:hypothetical protein
LRTELLGELTAWPIATKPITTKRKRSGSSFNKLKKNSNKLKKNSNKLKSN